MNWDQNFRLDVNDQEWAQLQTVVNRLAAIYKPAVPKPVSGSRGGNAALANLITKLATAGLIVDNTTP